jgi:hypothetical protein
LCNNAFGKQQPIFNIVCCADNQIAFKASAKHFIKEIRKWDVPEGKVRKAGVGKCFQEQGDWQKKELRNFTFITP